MAKRLEDLVAFQFALEFKLEVYRLIDASPTAPRDFKFKDQLTDAAAGIERAMAEGFGRRKPLEFANSLRYALGSLAEAKTGLADGVLRRHFSSADCSVALTWAERCKSATKRLHASQLRLAAKNQDAARRRNTRRRPSNRDGPRQ
jgi:hypothetical protein